MITAIKIILWFLSPFCSIGGVVLCVCGIYNYVEEISTKLRAVGRVLFGLIAFAIGITGIVFAVGGAR